MTWWVDESGNPARKAPPHPGKSSGVWFNPDYFERAIQEQGSRVRWEQAARCPCATNDQTDSANPLCPVCRGTAWEYHSPLEIPGIIDRLETRIENLDQIGDLTFGSASITVQSIHRLNNRDRIVLLDHAVSYSEVVRRSAVGTPDRLAFPIAKITDRVLTTNAAGQQVSRTVTFGVTRLRLMTDERIPGVISREGRDFGVTADGQIDWTDGDRLGTAPAPGQPYAITYLQHPSYLITNFPFGSRVLAIKRKQPTKEYIQGPISAFMLMEARQDHRPASEPS